MTRDHVIVTWAAGDTDGDGLRALLAAYHLRTEAEKGVPVVGPERLPERYRVEVEDPGTAFADDVVLVARRGDIAIGCVVLAAPVEGRAEIKRLWVDPGERGRGVAGALVRAALTRAHGTGLRSVRLSVWRWRTTAIALYERLGFTVTESWDSRDDLVCMEHAFGGGGAA
ncbi:GNAT family N-acetyltransferase [Microbispora sp. GKU 823]|uniref:GNAT family N-acetyltransferase n=1 Tax=Microbispora sp. GKU 823 TaxID=1652100 RepID=UPI0009A2D2E6|nr:GNAT family N-acetyltransferase [Microbispora sp. GKU 823]OPG13925.1 GNAT family N-acetyltransferase [Microbispora sp. GKU 823]